MDKNVQARIVEIANECQAGGTKMTRADLSYELKDLGVESDSPEVTRAVWDAYVASRRNAAVRDAFVENAGSRPLVDAYEMAARLNDGNAQMALKLLEKDSKDSESALERLDEGTTFALSREESEQLASLMSIVTGTSGVQHVKQQAAEIFERYSELVSNYDNARECATATVSDFTALRSDIEKSYKRYVMALIDIFGDSVKTIAPQMFDYDSIEWLDVHGMLEKAELRYGTVNTRCANLLGEISESFKKSATRACDMASKGEVGLVIACVEMVSHYADASTKTAAVKGDLLNLRNDIRKDATCIKGDMLRLAKIFKTLNDLHIPRARIFYKHASTVLDDEFKSILSAVYSTPEAKRLEARRQELLDVCAELERRVESEKNDVAYYAGHIKDCENVMKAVEGPYEDARTRKPHAPNFLVNVMTFGGARREYNRKLFDWKTVCGPIVDQYNHLLEDVKLDGDEKAAQEKSLKADLVELDKTKSELKTVNLQIRRALGENLEARVRLLPHLKDVVALLRVAKDVLESKLEEKDVKAVSIDDAGRLTIPASMEKTLNAYKSFVLKLCRDQSLELEESDAADHGDDVCEDASTGPAKSSNGDSLAELSISEEMLVDKMTDALTAWSRYNALAESERSNKARYDAQQKRMRDEFLSDMAKLDNKAEALHAVLARINLSENATNLKQGLRELADIGESWSDADWDRFISGDRTLSI